MKSANVLLTLCIITLLAIIVVRVCAYGDTRSQLITFVGICIAAAISHLTDNSKKNTVKTGGSSKNDESRIIEHIKNIYEDFLKDQKLVYEYKQIPRKVKYVEDDRLMNFNCHLGQRKLLLTEIEFYSKCLKSKDETALVIYAGSASCEHLPVILDMFPNLKFILVDPNYHSIDKYEFEYVYQNVHFVDKGNLKLFQKHLHATHHRGEHLKRTTEFLRTVKFTYDDTYDVLDTAHSYHYADKHKEMDRVMAKFYSKDYKTLIPDIMKSDKRVYIFQDYMTEKLSTTIAQSKKKTPTYFLTDIRTNVYEGDSPHDIDILWNYALQMIYLKILQPEFSMLKFRPPFMGHIHSSQSREMKSFMKTTAPAGFKRIIKQDFETVKNKYKLDLFGNYLNGKFLYFRNDFIYVQPWGRVATTETRLFVSKANINKPYIPYDVKEWEDKFMYVKILRMYGFHSIFYGLTPVKDYDGCYDCTRELQILGNYMLNSPDVSPDINNKKIVSAIKKNPQKIKELYDLINKYTFFDLSNRNYKCSFHGKMLKVPKYISVITRHKHLTRYDFPPGTSVKLHSCENMDRREIKNFIMNNLKYHGVPHDYRTQ